MRAPFRYYGGKGRMVKKLLSLVPEGGRPYCEPFAGAASLLFARKPAPVEVLNDIDGDIVNLFRVLQDREKCEEFQHRLLHTPYSQTEFVRAIEVLESDERCPVQRAWALFVVLNQSHSARIMNQTPGRWGRTFTSTAGIAQVTNQWIARLSHLPDWHRRLLMVQLDNRDAIEVIQYWDNPSAVFYVDPPYVSSARVDEESAYRNDHENELHVRLVETILRCHGAVVLSGYESDIYRPLIEADWRVVRFEVSAGAASRHRGSRVRGPGNALKYARRVECVWLNPRAWESVHKTMLPLVMHNAPSESWCGDD